MYKNTFLKYFIIFVCVISITGACGYLLSERKSVKGVKRAVTEPGTEASTEATSSMYQRDYFDGSITFEGKRYEPNTSIDTVLFLGVDSSDQSREGVGIAEGGRSDTMILFVIDNKKKLITPLEINRDTMVEVDIYDNDGNYLSQGTEQITMQYSYGKSARQACNLTKGKVSDLLNRTRIDSIMSLTIDGIVPIVDSIGGVTLQLSSDETDLDPSYVEGAVIHLDGAAALDFVHLRDTKVRGSNIERMSRQTQFMMAMFQNIKQQGSSVVEKMEEAAGDSLYKDIDADSVEHMTNYDYAEEILMLPGKNETDRIHDEFYVDDYELTKMILDLFYIESK